MPAYVFGSTFGLVLPCFLLCTIHFDSFRFSFKCTFLFLRRYGRLQGCFPVSRYSEKNRASQLRKRSGFRVAAVLGLVSKTIWNSELPLREDGAPSGNVACTGEFVWEVCRKCRVAKHEGLEVSQAIVIASLPSSEFGFANDSSCGSGYVPRGWCTISSNGSARYR